MGVCVFTDDQFLIEHQFFKFVLGAAARLSENVTLFEKASQLLYPVDNFMVYNFCFWNHDW